MGKIVIILLTLWLLTGCSSKVSSNNNLNEINYETIENGVSSKVEDETSVNDIPSCH